MWTEPVCRMRCPTTRAHPFQPRPVPSDPTRQCIHPIPHVCRTHPNWEPSCGRLANYASLTALFVAWTWTRHVGGGVRVEPVVLFKRGTSCHSAARAETDGCNDMWT
eukprot:2599461-Alexandrium_andersonii.AAC.1